MNIIESMLHNHFFSVFIVTMVTATNNHEKELQFRAIEDKQEEFCTVVRNGM